VDAAPYERYESVSRSVLDVYDENVNTEQVTRTRTSPEALRYGEGAAPGSEADSAISSVPSDCCASVVQVRLDQLYAPTVNVHVREALPA
jgi:hypothetical protein